MVNMHCSDYRATAPFTLITKQQKCLCNASVLKGKEMSATRKLHFEKYYRPLINKNYVKQVSFWQTMAQSYVGYEGKKASE